MAINKITKNLNEEVFQEQEEISEDSDYLEQVAKKGGSKMSA